MACRLAGVKPLSEPMLEYCQWTPRNKLQWKPDRNPYIFKKMHSTMSSRKWRPFCLSLNVLTHWGRVTHICVSKPTTIGSDNGLSPGRRQAIIWTNAGILLIGPLGINSEIHTFSLKKKHFKMSSGKWRPFCLSLNVLMVAYWCRGGHNAQRPWKKPGV